MQNKKHILIIDDEKGMVDLLKDFFEKNNFSTEIATDGIMALACIKIKLPDFVITDLLLPGEHGINIVKTIKKKYFIPIIMMSGIYKEEEVRDMMDEYFVEAFFEKPFDLNVLLKKVNSILNAKAL